MEPSDVPEVLDVLRAALGETPILKRTRELWAWKHERNPFGKSLALVAVSGGRIAGVRAMMRWDMATPEGPVLRCLRPVDTATHPEFGRQGIFRSLTESAIERAKESGLDLIFNTPNQASGPGYLKMGWQEVGPIGVMVRPLLRWGERVPPNEAPTPDAFFAAGTDPAGAHVQDRAPMGLRTPRTPEYMRWRFEGHPTAGYRSISARGARAIVRSNLRSGRKELVVSELFGSSPARAVRRVARLGRAAYVAAWFSPGSPERRAALAGGMVPIPGVRALTLMAYPLGELPVNVLSLDSWDIGLGDLELL